MLTTMAWLLCIKTVCGSCSARKSGFFAFLAKNEKTGSSFLFIGQLWQTVVQLCDISFKRASLHVHWSFLISLSAVQEHMTVQYMPGVNREKAPASPVPNWWWFLTGVFPCDSKHPAPFLQQWHWPLWCLVMVNAAAADFPNTNGRAVWGLFILSNGVGAWTHSPGSSTSLSSTLLCHYLCFLWFLAQQRKHWPTQGNNVAFKGQFKLQSYCGSVNWLNTPEYW